MEIFYPVVDQILKKTDISKEEFSLKYNRRDFDFRNRRFPAIDFSGFDLTQFQLEGADLRLVRNLSQAKLSGVNFTRCDLRGHDFSGRELSNTLFHKARLERTNFSGAKCLKANFSNASLKRASCVQTFFGESNLSKADFTHASLSKSRFNHANLAKADLSYANTTCCDFSYASLSKTRFWGNPTDGTNFLNTSVTEKQLKNADRGLHPIIVRATDLFNILWGKY